MIFLDLGLDELEVDELEGTFLCEVDFERICSVRAACRVKRDVLLRVFANIAARMEENTNICDSVVDTCEAFRACLNLEYGSHRFFHDQRNAEFPRLCDSFHEAVIYFRLMTL